MSRGEIAALILVLTIAGIGFWLGYMHGQMSVCMLQN